MNPIARNFWILALAAVLAAGCGARTTSSDAGAAHHEAGQQDAAPDGPVDAGPRVRDVCSYQWKYPPTVAEPVLQAHPYAYYCRDEMNDPDCVQNGYSDFRQAWEYDCTTPP